jgi:hypothetical protein
MADNAAEKPITTDLDAVIRALARQQARADFARLNLPQNTENGK